mmetsp:Transcript_20973/g.42610  ORF Transcript_20973/g.42610 Transcript_20973/m.42610 type:complete len:80 (+) Transcript_20973:1081-1320(+)
MATTTSAAITTTLLMSLLLPPLLLHVMLDKAVYNWERVCATQDAITLVGHCLLSQQAQAQTQDRDPHMMRNAVCILPPP